MSLPLSSFLFPKKQSKKSAMRIMALFLLTGMFSCNYNFSDDYYVDIEIPEANSTLELAMFDGEPVLFEPTTTNYHYKGQDNQELRQVAVYIDDQLVNYFHKDSDAFLINTDNLSEGEHILKIVYTFSSGSGSLADLNNGESYTKTEEYRFTVDKSAPEEVLLTDVEVIEGSIFVSWNPINTNNFSEAVLRVQNPESNRIIEDIPLSSEDMAAGIFNDISNTALNLDYSIILTNRYAESTSNRLNLSLPKPTLRGEVITNTQYKIIWEEHPLYGNFDYYSYNVRPNNTFVELSNRGGEYIVNDDPVFAQPEHHSLYLKRTDSYDSLHFVGDQMHFGKIFEKKWGANYIFSEQTNSYYTLHLQGSYSTKEVVLSELDGENFSTLRSEVLFTTNDSYGNIILDPNDNTIILDLNKSSHKIDVSTFSILESWNANDYAIPGDYNIITSYRNGSLVIRKISRDWMHIYDIATSNLIYNDDIGYRFFLSDDGLHFYNNRQIHKINNGSVNAITTTYDNQFVHAAAFIPELNACIFSNVYSNPVIYYFATGNSQTISSLTDVGEINYDPISGKILLYQHIHENGLGAYVNLYDPISELIKPLEVYDSHTSNRYIYLNGKLIYTGGFYLDNYLN